MNKNKLIYDIYFSIMIIFLFEPNIFVKYNIVNMLFIFGAAISFFSIFMIFLKYKINLNKPLLFMILYRIIALLSTIIYGGDILKVGYQSLIIISLLMYASFFYERGKINYFLKIILNIFITYLTFNILSYIMFPNGLYSINTKMFFLGIRTRFTEYSLSCIILSIICYKNKTITLLKELLCIFISMLNIILPNISTAYVGILFFIPFYIILKKLTLNKSKTNYKLIIIPISIITILIVFARIQNLFSFLIVDILGKDLTLSNRTYIWDLAIQVIKSGNLIIGNGYILDGNFVPFAYGNWQAHNQLLQLFYETGFLGLLAFLGFIMSSLKTTKKKNTKTDILIIASVGALLVMMITEIYAYFIASYIVFILCYYRDSINNAGDENNEKSKYNNTCI